jgi:hypothetical protein
MFFKSLQIAAFIVMMGSVVQGQTYWSASQPNCGPYENLTVQLNTGGNGYSCGVVGIFPWFTAGAGWTTSIRTAAPASAAIAFLFAYQDIDGNPLAVDANYVDGPGVTRGQTSFLAALNPNEPAQLDLLGLPSESSINYSKTAAQGSILAGFLCPDAITCAQATAQLIYSALPSQPWSLSIPIVWNAQLTSEWSTWGYDDGKKQIMSFVITNGSSDPQAYAVHVFDTYGNPFRTVNTPSIPAGGTYAQVLDQFLGNTTPGGLIKMTVTGTGASSAFEALQFNSGSATTLVVFPEGSVPLIGKNSVNHGLPRLRGLDQIAPHIERQK